MNNGYFPSYFNPHGLVGAPPGTPHAPVLDPALSSWTANPHLAAAAMAAAAAEQLRNNSAVAAAAHHAAHAAHAASTAAGGPQPPPPPPHHHPNPAAAQGGGFHHHPFPYPTSSYGSGLGSSVPPISTSITSRLLAEEKSVDKRPPIISKPGNVSTSPSISSWSSRISDTATSHMFNTGLPPLDRQGLFPSHGSILDPLQTASFSNKSRSSSTTLVPAPQTDSFRPKENAKTVVPSAAAAQQPPPPVVHPPVAPPPTVTQALCVNLASESDEEVLVDDFDGQCCRTYPENHSRIIKWRAQRTEKLRLQQVQHPPPPAQQKQQDAQPPITGVTQPPPPPSSSSARTTSTTTTAAVKPMSSSLVPRKSQDGGKSSSVPTTSGSSIPVGIAIGRQRQPGSLNPQHPWKPLPSPTSAGTSTIPPPLGSLGASSSSSGTPALPPATPNLHQGLHHNPWLPPHHLQPSPAGPIPMGYQLAKDPLTGQILLIPTDPTQPPSHHGSSWPHIPGPYGAVDRTPPGVLQSHYHHLYMQQQQLRYYQELHQGAADHHALSRLQHLQRQDLLRGPVSPSCSSLASRRPLFDRNKEPETITVSDDDDEVSKPAKGTVVPTTTATTSTNNIPPASSSKDKIVHAHTAVNLAKPISSTTTSQNIIPEEIKSVKTQHDEEVDKTESKQIHDDVSKAAQQLPVSNIKQEPGLNDPEEHIEQPDDNELKLIAESLLDLSCSTSSWIQAGGGQHKADAPEAPLDIDINDHDEEVVAKTFINPEHDQVFGALLKGIELHEQSKDGIDMLCAVTHQEARTQKISYNSSHVILNSRFDVLCCVTKRDKIVIDEYIDPLILLKQQINLRDHQTSAETIQSFIQTKAQYYKRLQEQGSESYDHQHNGGGSDLAPTNDICPSLTKMIKKIKNTEFMSDLEIELRNQLIQLQEDYKEKQSQLSRFKSPKKKYQKKLKRNKRSSPASKAFSTPSPAKRFVASKQQQQRRISSSPALSSLSSITAGTSSGTTNPPRLEPNSSPPRLHNSAAESWKQSSALLKPPKLTASLAHHPQRNSNRGNSVTNLADIKSRFMKGKANPFANLISKLATTSSNSGSTSPVKANMPDIDEENEENTAESSSENNIANTATAATSAAVTTTDTDIDKEDEDDDVVEESVTESDSDLEDEYEFNVKKALKLSARGHHPFGSKRGRSSSMEDSSSSKKRKADKPKKQSSTISETIVPKKPKNLFMMNCYEFESGFMSQEEKEISTTAAASASTSTVGSAASTSSSSGANNSTSPTKKSTQSPAKAKKSTKVDLHSKGAKDSKLRDAKLLETDLSDGLKLLILQEGRFWPARLNSTQLPDVYGIVMEKQRGNRPQILPRDDILKEAIFEVKPDNKRQIPIGTRVCVYWSRAYNCLFPGTIEELEDVVLDKDNMVQVLLDDGDRRQVDVGSVRMLPQDYSHVDYDPDPIATLRKRRMSADSMDSGSGAHRETMHSLMSNQLMLSPLAKSESNKLATRNKPDKHKHKKKKKHHHCKRKHKRSDKHEDDEDEDEDDDDDDDDDFEDDTLKIKLDGSFNNTTTYSIRSPMYHNRSEESNHEEGEEEDDLENDFNNETSSGDDSTSSDDDDAEKKPSKKLNRGINPVTGRPLWNWADEGYRRPGSKGKAKKLFHRSVSRDNETINVGDCAVFLSTARVDRPYIGQVELLWETWNSNMMVKVKWFYHPEEIEISTADSVDLRVPGGLFQSPHTDENDVQTISHKCSVLPLKEYSKMMISDPVKRKKIYTSSDTYYLAGSYDPTAMTVNFQPGVLRH